MKIITRTFSIFMLFSIILFLFSSFTPHEKEDNLKYSNIEILSQGEESPYPECTMDDGHCIKGNGFIFAGMVVAQQKK